MIETGKRIKKIRTTRKLTQQELAEKSGIDVTLISKYENGKKEIGLDNLKRICEALDTSLDYIVYGKGSDLKYFINPVNTVSSIFPKFITLTELEPIKEQYDKLPVVLQQYFDEIEILLKTYKFPRLDAKMDIVIKEYTEIFNYHMQLLQYDEAFNHKYFDYDFPYIAVDNFGYDGPYEPEDEEYQEDFLRFLREQIKNLNYDE